MNPDHGVWYGIAFDTVLFGSITLFFWARHRFERARREKQRVRIPGGADRLLRRMRLLARPSLLLVPAQEPGFSKLGGDPELTDGVKWPVDAGRPRSFIAQIDLSAFRAHGGPEWLPHEGRLYAFVDEDRNGFSDLVRMLYSLDPPGPRASPPPGVGKTFAERRVAFETYSSIPSLDWLGIDLSEVDVSPEELDELSDAPDKPFGDELQHRIGGYPSEIQDERMSISCELTRRGLPLEHEGTEVTPAIERASKQWRLLLQIDSDPALSMNWGDGGRLYVFVREKDAVAGDFSRTVTISQTY
ncbi:MAG TPA: YwqG family protein [Phenylobacterium sp.]